MWGRGPALYKHNLKKKKNLSEVKVIFYEENEDGTCIKKDLGLSV
jgi:hypothetical protein